MSVSSWQLILLVFLIFFTSFAFSEEEDSSLNLIYQKITQLEEELSALRSLVEENTYLIEKSQELHKQRPYQKLSVTERSRSRVGC